MDGIASGALHRARCATVLTHRPSGVQSAASARLPEYTATSIVCCEASAFVSMCSIRNGSSEFRAATSYLQ